MTHYYMSKVHMGEARYNPRAVAAPRLKHFHKATRERTGMMEEEHDSPIAMRVYVRDEVFHLTTSQIAFDSPESNLFSTSLARGVRVLKSDMSPSLFSLIIDHLSGYPIFPLPPSTNVNLNYLLLDAQRLGLDDLERMVKKEMFRTKSLPFLDREHVRNLVTASTTGNGSGSGSEPLDVTRLLKNPEMFASISEVVEPTLEDDEGIYKLSQISDDFLKSDNRRFRQGRGAVRDHAQEPTSL
ncbi:hypothetical protein BT69DRAFT_380803 [Atractiella rhizophila]|nr:hypothetical protein BT69DRAFT_380803 [Atractiella rhizophila]